MPSASQVRGARLWMGVVLGSLLFLACGESDTGSTNSGSTDSGTVVKDASDDHKSVDHKHGESSGDGTASTSLATEAGLNDDLKAKIAGALKKARHAMARLQDENGGFGDPGTGMPPNVGYTAMATMGMLAATTKTQVAKDEAIGKALDFIAKQQKENGAIFDHPQFVNYGTSVAVGTFALARIPKYRRNQEKAMQFLVDSQIDDDPENLSFGGFPYKQDQGQPADLSNAQIAATAAYDAGLAKDHVLWKNLNAFTKRVHNDTESNTQEHEIKHEGKNVVVVSGQDGGAMYGPGLVKAGLIKRSDGKWEVKSYGSMGYALLKCLLFSGVKPTDRRVEILIRWLSDNWTTERNPGFESQPDPEKAGKQGLYYYYYTCARALAEYEKHLGKPLRIKDAKGKYHNWRSELAATIISRQGEDGLWKNNAASRWGEDAQTLVTGYAMQSLGFLTGRLP